MSYCVNCGVELAASEKACPLCKTVVINPNSPVKKAAEMPYANIVEQPTAPKIDRSGFAMLFTIILMIPVLITLAVDFFTNQSISWSLYVLCSIIMVFFWLVFPFFFKTFRAVPMLILDIASALAFLYLIERLTLTSRWFLGLATPITLALGLIAIVIYRIFSGKKRPRFLTRISIILFAIGLFVVIIETIITNYAGKIIVTSWSVYVMIPCLLLGVAALFIDSRSSIKEQIRKKLFL